MYKALPSPEPTVLIEVNHYIVHLACTKKMQIWVEVLHKVFNVKGVMLLYVCPRVCVCVFFGMQSSPAEAEFKIPLHVQL